MREIKFRAWDNAFNKMFEVIQVSYEESETLAWRFPFEGERVGWSSAGWEVGKECELMQYTGLKDKNGVEIYEGDIYKTPTGLTGQVFFHANGGWLVETKEVEFTLLKINASKQGKVIGNIYENPELLEGTK